MTSRQTAAICATILLAAMANLAGGFAMQVYFDARRPHSAEYQRQLADDGRYHPPPLNVYTDNTAGLSAPRQLSNLGQPKLIPLPSPTADIEDITAAVIGDGVGQPSEVRDGRRYSPRELPSPGDALPIQPRPIVDASVMASIIEKELPDATPEERQVWMQQLAGLNPSEMRNLLQMRRRFGSELPKSLETLLPPEQPLNLDLDGDTAPVVAPVPFATQPSDDQ